MHTTVIDPTKKYNKVKDHKNVAQGMMILWRIMAIMHIRFACILSDLLVDEMKSFLTTDYIFSSLSLVLSLQSIQARQILDIAVSISSFQALRVV